jgi:hypothetical protein
MLRAAALLAVAGLLLLSGCGGDDDDGGETANGRGYEVTLPSGWTERDEQEDLEKAGIGTDSIWLGRTVEGFRVNANVIVESSIAAGTTAREYVEAGRRLLRDPRAREQLGIATVPTGFEPIRTTRLDGEPAAGSGYRTEVGGKRLRHSQVAAIRDGAGYSVTYTAPADEFDQQLDDFESIVRSWRWD